MKFKPQGDKILLRKKFEQYEGVLVLPDTAKRQPPVEGVVIAIGEYVSQFVQAGDTVVYGMYAAADIKDKDMIGDDNFAIIMEGDIMYKKEAS